MKTFKLQISGFALLLASLLTSTAYGQITPLGDSYTNTADSTTNYGAKTLLDVDGATEIAYIQFNLASIPSTANVSQATLKLFVNSVTSDGSFNVDYVKGPWSESTITGELAPALGSVIASNVSVVAEDRNQYILINITPAVEAWLSGSEPNNGIALVANGAFSASFDSKENTATGHSPELDVVLATAGNLQWNGSDLVCVQSPATAGGVSGGINGAASPNIGIKCGGGGGGGGTITGVTAGTDLTGGGTSGNVTLNVDTTKIPQLNAANTFTGNQTVNGNLSATGMVSGSGFQIGSNLFDYGSYVNANAFLGFAGNTTTTGYYNTAVGSQALGSNTTGLNNTAEGLLALYYNTQGNGNIAVGGYALYSNTIGGPNNAFGFEALAGNTTGGPNDAFGYRALYSNTMGYNNDAFGYGALNSNTTGYINAAFGYQALYSNTTGSANTAVGPSALLYNTTGYNNTALGVSALGNNTTGYDNTAVGILALESNTTGSDLTCIGQGCNASEDGLRNATAIGAHAVVGQSNSLVLGGTGDHAVNVGIGTTKPSNILTIGRGLGHPVSDSWETYSSRRWKTNIHTLDGALGKVEQLRGVSYDLKDSGKHEIGVIAEEVGQVVPEVVSFEENGKDARGVDYSRLTALLIEATKEQQILIHQQEREIARLRSQVKSIQAALKNAAPNSSKVER